ncbi:uncharacterized protein LOC113212902 [Frankliniella occidentalis]|uniref:Uncharacterized protein LOC113212902 n=1 Tax=Frankliniella occidentalis TaxID=133901 RepID=A0A6J1T788_FRAOC|nr:uncharacterized protein LOC113212902 [Frankliniella occidentalis]
MDENSERNEEEQNRDRGYKNEVTPGEDREDDEKMIVRDTEINGQENTQNSRGRRQRLKRQQQRKDKTRVKSSGRKAKEKLKSKLKRKLKNAKGKEQPESAGPSGTEPGQQESGPQIPEPAQLKVSLERNEEEEQNRDGGDENKVAPGDDRKGDKEMIIGDADRIRQEKTQNSRGRRQRLKRQQQRKDKTRVKSIGKIAREKIKSKLKRKLKKAKGKDQPANAGSGTEPGSGQQGSGPQTREPAPNLSKVSRSSINFENDKADST